MLVSTLLLVLHADPQEPMSARAQVPAEIMARYRRHPELLEKADWAEPPKAPYPATAREAGVEGSATLHCIVEVTGQARDCEIESEFPASMGFGEAALSAASTYKFVPAKFDGQLIETPMTFPVRFAMEEEGPDDADTQAVVEAISELGLAIGWCRVHQDQATTDHWDRLASMMEADGPMSLRAYDQLFVNGHRVGERQVERQGARSAAQCDQMKARAEAAVQGVESQIQRLEAANPEISGGGLRPDFP